MRRERCRAGAARVTFDPRTRPEDRDPPIGERVLGAALGDEQGRSIIAFEIFRVLGESAHQEDGIALVKRHGHERTVGIARRLEGQGAEGPD